MATVHETGHAKNVANFQDLISFTTGYAAAYNTGNAAITLASLNAQHTAATGDLTAVNTALAAWVTAVNDREALFEPFSRFVTRVMNAVQASAAPPEVIADVRTIVRKLTGARATPAVPDDPATPENESQSSNSASQMSFDSRIENFDKLIQLLAAQAGYVPNEPDLKATGLTGLPVLYASMQAANLAVINAYTALSNARIARDKELYEPTTGLVDLAFAVKNYIKSLFGAASPEFQQVSALQFTRPRTQERPHSSEQADRPSFLAERPHIPVVRHNVLPGQLSILAVRPSVLPKRPNILAVRPNILAGQLNMLALRRSILPEHPNILVTTQNVLPQRPDILALRPGILVKRPTGELACPVRHAARDLPINTPLG